MAESTGPTTANEALMLFSSALSSPADSEQQAGILEQLRSALEREPAFIRALYSTILSLAGQSGPLLKRWIADVVELVVARLALTSNALGPDQRVQSESIWQRSVHSCSPPAVVHTRRLVRLPQERLCLFQAGLCKKPEGDSLCVHAVTVGGSIALWSRAANVQALRRETLSGTWAMLRYIAPLTATFVILLVSFRKTSDDPIPRCHPGLPREP